MADPSALGQALLDAAAAAVVDPPDRQYRSPGTVAVDCEQLAVTLRRVLTSTTVPNQLADPIRCAAPPLYEFAVELWRCIPGPDRTGQPPAASALTTAAAVAEADAEDLRIMAATNPFGGACSRVAVGPVEIVGPQGGLVGVRVVVSVAP